MSIAIADPQARLHVTGVRETGRRPRAWRVYLALAACLAPLCYPAGPGQTAMLDFVNLIAMAVAALVVLSPGCHVRMPLLVPVGIIVVGSLLAMFSAPAVGLGVMTLAQDLYLFAWFVLMVNMVQDAGSLRTLQVAWMWAAVGVALGAVGQVLAHSGGSLGTLLGSRGIRPNSTLYNPNVLADYLVISLFITTVAAKRLPRLLRPVVFGVLVLGLLTTKSNGGMIALAGGGAVWLLVRVATSGAPLRGWVAALAMTLAMVGLGAWLHVEWGVGDSVLKALRTHTFVGRMEHSGESRMRIWDSLERTYARSPLGIGPGNSTAIQLSIAERERPGSYMSKEAHSDYLAYAIERGPLGLLGLLAMTAASFLCVATYWRHARTLGARARGAGAWTAAMAASLMSSTIHSTVIEKLHFRHYWLLLAMVCGSMYMAAQQAEQRAGRRAEREAARKAALQAAEPALGTALALRTGTNGSLPAVRS